MGNFRPTIIKMARDFDNATTMHGFENASTSPRDDVTTYNLTDDVTEGTLALVVTSSELERWGTLVVVNVLSLWTLVINSLILAVFYKKFKQNELDPYDILLCSIVIGETIVAAFAGGTVLYLNFNFVLESRTF